MFLGLEIGGTKLQVVRGDEHAGILERRRFAVDRAGGAAGIRRQIEQGISELTGGKKPDSVGVGFGGPIDWETGRICRSHQIEGWAGFDLAGWLRQITGAVVRIDNDANVAALAEALRGAGSGCNPVFNVIIGSGLGGGLIVDGRIYHGAKPGEAEIGHIRLDRQGTTVESRCCGWAVDAKIRELKTREPESLLARLTEGMSGGEAKQLSAALAQGDAAARRILQETAEDLAFGLSHAVHLFHPEALVIGGGLSAVGEPLRAAVATALRGWVMEAFAPGPKVLLSALKEDIVPVGALLLAVQGR